jgi:ketosteroid isomerase-like protein
MEGESDNVRLARMAYEAWNRNDLGGILERCDPDIEWHMSEVFAPGGRVMHGHDGVREIYESLRASFSVLRVRPLEFHEEYGRIVVPVQMTGRSTESGGDVSVDLVHAWTHRDQLAVRLDVYATLEEARTATRT